MNERIRELLGQCKEESIDGPGYPDWVDQEKFAELIVKECIGIIVKENDGDEYGSGNDWGDGYTAGLNTAKLAIEEHFEIKEN